MSRRDGKSGVGSSYVAFHLTQNREYLRGLLSHPNVWLSRPRLSLYPLSTNQNSGSAWHLLRWWEFPVSPRATVPRAVFPFAMDCRPDTPYIGLQMAHAIFNKS